MASSDLRIQALLRKFVRNQCSEVEIEELIAHFQENPSKTDMPKVEEVLEQLQKVPSLSKQADRRMQTFISKEISRRRGNRSRESTIRSMAVAAIFIGILLLTYFSREMLHPSLQAPTEPQQDQITLQLEDGNFEVIEAAQTKRIFNSQGTKIGEVKGNQLVFEAAPQLDSLIYNEVSVPFGKTLDILLADGSKVQLNAGSKFRFPVNFIEGKKREVFLEGEAYFDIASDPEHPFVVQAEGLNVEVLGTRFNLMAYPEDHETQVVLVEGTVGMYSKQDEKDQQVILAPGEQGVFHRGDRQIAVSEVSTGTYTSWRKGELVFRNVRFDQILQRLERHYNVEIANNAKDKGVETFNGNFGKEPLEKVLEYFKRIYDIQYSIHENKVIIK